MMMFFAARADHITGGEMYYEYITSQGGNHVYRVTLRLLMRCNSGRQFPNPIWISVFANGIQTRMQDFLVPMGNQQSIRLQLTDPCISNAPDVCYDVATYVTDVQLPPSALGYTVAAQVNFRVNGLANLNSGLGGVGATYTAEIPGSADIDAAFINTSATFSGSDLVVVCANSPFTYSFAARDADGDSLRYAFCSAYQSGTTFAGQNSAPPVAPPYPPVPYGNGFSSNSPLGAPVTVDPFTGLVSGRAPGAGIYVITVCVSEIRKGKVIATQRKDIQLNITNCTIAAALLQPAYQLCADTDIIEFENLSASPLIETYAWRLTNRQGATVASSQDPRFTYRFTDTGLYRITLAINRGIACSDSFAAPVIFYPGFRPGFSFSGQCFGGITQFTDRTSSRYGTVLNRRWNLDEPGNAAQFAQGPQPQITYAREGTKNVSLWVENSNGCADSITRAVEISRHPPLQIPVRDTLICPPDTLTLRVVGEGTFLWDNTPGLIAGGQTATPRVAPAATTWYRVTQQVGSCVGTDSIRVRVTPGVVLQVMADTVICAGDSMVISTSGNGLQYSWLPAAGLSDAASAAPMASPAAATRYTVTASVSNCRATASVWVRPVPYPQADAGPDTAVCFGNSLRLQGRATGSSMEWLPGTTVLSNGIPTPVVQPGETTTYTFRVFAGNGCPKPAEDQVTVRVEPPIALQVVSDTSVVAGQPLQLQATGAPLYRWDPFPGLSDPQAANPTVIFTQNQAMAVLRVTGFNTAGCSDAAVVRVQVFAGPPAIYVPTAFSPNADGLNETLKPTLAGMQRFDFFRVYNRFGEMMYSTARIQEGWNGFWKGTLQPAGTYIWMAQAVDYLGKPILLKGTAMLIR